MLQKEAQEGYQNLKKKKKKSISIILIEKRRKTKKVGYIRNYYLQHKK